MHDTKEVELYLSNFSTLELERVVSRLQLDPEKLQKVISTRFASVKINQSNEKVQERFAHYLRDIDDANVVAGAKIAKVTFLVSYNIRHFESDKLSQDFQIILLTPGFFTISA
jgi:predicted nucleic acid-binding protein